MDRYLANINGGKRTPLMRTVCPECPWRKVDNRNQHYPAAGEKIFNMVENSTPMSCHMTQKSLMAMDTEVHRCRGIEIFRANIGIKSEVGSDNETVFANKKEALNRWPIMHTNWERTRREFFSRYPLGHYSDENERMWIAGNPTEETFSTHRESCELCSSPYRIS